MMFLHCYNKFSSFDFIWCQKFNTNLQGVTTPRCSLSDFTQSCHYRLNLRKVGAEENITKITHPFFLLPSIHKALLNNITLSQLD